MSRTTDTPIDRKLVLYYAAGSCALAPLIALEEAGASFALRQVNLAAGEQRDSRHLALNGLGRVPVLADGDFVLTENVAILRYLARRFPDAGLWPADARAEARCLEWLAFGASSLHPAMAHVRRPARYAGSDAACAEVAAVGEASVAALLRLVESRLTPGEWAAGRQMTVADLYLLFFWTHAPGTVRDFVPDDFPKWSALARRLHARPAVRRAMVADGIDAIS